MAQSITLPVKGLHVDPNPILMGSAGKGALCRAEEVVFTRQGSATSRPALRGQDLIVSDHRPRSMYPWGDGVLMSVYDGGTWELVYPDGTSVTGDGTPPEPGLTPMQFLEARGSLYLTTDAGVRKLQPGNVVTEKPGSWVLPWFLFGFGLTGGPFGDGVNNFRAAYRYVLVSEDEQGYIRRSAPSPRLDLSQTGAAATGYGISGRFYITNDAKEGDILEMYRTKVALVDTTTPSEEYYLAFTIVLSANDILNGFTDAFSDETLDEALGVALYTNPSEGGIQAANELPPLARAMASFENCAWFGNVQHRQRVINSFTGGPTAAQVASWSQAGCSLTASSNVITGVTSTANLRVGMAVAAFTGPGSVGDGYWGEGSIYLSPDTLITGLTATTVTMDKPALLTATRDIEFAEVVTITRGTISTNFYWRDSVPLPALTTAGFNLRVFGTDETDPILIAKALQGAFTYVVNAYFWGNEGAFSTYADFVGANSEFGVGTTGDPGKFIISTMDFGGDELIFEFGGDTTYFRIAPNPQTADASRKPHRIYYSKPFEPEAVPLANFIEVGSEADAIVAMVQAGSALYVFKTDGVFRVSGSAPASWRIDRVSVNNKLLYGGAACAIGRSAIAWTNQGVMAFTDMSVESLSTGKIDSLLRPLEPFLTPNRIVDNAYTTWLQYWPKHDLLLLGFSPLPASGEVAALVDPALYCLSVSTGDWSKWSCDLWCAVPTPDGELVAVWRKSNQIDVRTTDSDESGHDVAYYIAFDGSTVITSTSVSGLVLGSYIPREKDWVALERTSGGSTWRRVSAYNSSTGVISWVTPLEAADLEDGFVGSAFYETITTKLQWQTNGLVGKASLFRELLPLYSFTAESERGTISMTAGAASDLATPLYTAENEAMTPGLVRSRLDRFGVAREVARSTHFYPYLETGEPAAHWAIHGITVEFEPSSEKMRR